MDDSCAVCAEPLEWVAYGSCGHREVCSTCVARLRFICADRRCCICKTESNAVFVTKALGDYTRMINDFSVLPIEAREGRVGSYWYHEDTQCFFDDVDHYKIIKAMCRLSCSVCDKMEEAPHDATRRGGAFRNIKQLKDHLYHRHKLYMCNLCLGGRKVFICEQKLYTKAQLIQHKSTGDSEVDGTESDRGGFMGHPMCESCHSSFYGDNELYTHLSTEHFRCHICQRQHPEQQDYYKDYDDLEDHFRQEHFLCEDESCLGKKFIVFQSESELKRHNAMEHGGRMSRSKRNAALQIPTCFRYRRGNGQDNRRGRAETFHRDFSENQLSMAIQASLGTSNSDSAFLEQSSSSNGHVTGCSENIDIDPFIQPFDALTTSDSEAPSRYRQALGHNSLQSALVESSFPPLSTGTSNNQQQSNLNGLPSNTMAAHLRRKTKNNVSVLNSSRGWPGANRGPVSVSSNPVQSRLVNNLAPEMPRGSGQVKAKTTVAYVPPSYASTTQAWPKTATAVSASSSRISDTRRISHSISAPNLVVSGSITPSISDFPPVSAAQVSKMPLSKQSDVTTENIHTANKSLVDKIQAALEYNKDNYAAFKDISAQYRIGSIGTSKYLDFVQEFGLAHLVLELARLCPDPEKQKELLESYEGRVERNSMQENGRANDIDSTRDFKVYRKGKGKLLDAEESNSRDILANKILSNVKHLQSSYKASDEDVEVLSKEGYRTGKGKAKLINEQQQNIVTNSGSQVLKLSDEDVEVLSKEGYRTGKGKAKLINEQQQNIVTNSGSQVLKLDGQDRSSEGVIANQNSRDGGGGSKQRKKASKFLRARLGDGSAAALLDLRNSHLDSDMDSVDRNSQVDLDNPGGLPVRGVWRNGGGHKLFS